jgi:hypothetical protein
VSYLEEAAEQLRLARADNEKRAARTAQAEAAGSSPGTGVHADILREVNDRRLAIAEGFISLAAIREHMVQASLPAGLRPELQVTGDEPGGDGYGGITGDGGS